MFDSVSSLLTFGFMWMGGFFYRVGFFIVVWWGEILLVLSIPP